MFTMKGMLIAVVLTAGSGSYALAQTNSEIVTGGGQTVVVPKAATESKGISPVATQVVSDYPVFNQTMNNESIASTLVAQGFKNIKILREGSLMTITGTRGDDDINLVYNLVEGRLIKVNGERVLSEEEQTPDNSGSATTSPRSATPDGMSGIDDTGKEAADDTASDTANGVADSPADAGTEDRGTAENGTDDGEGSEASDTSDDDAGGNPDSGSGSESDSSSDSDSSNS